MVHVARAGRVIGLIAIADAPRPTAAATVAKLRELGVEVAMLTGDNAGTAQRIARDLGVDIVLADVLPGQKADKVKELQAQGKKVGMVGDGVNDAPALTQADVGFAIGAGTDVAIESADVVLMKSDPYDVVGAVELSHATLRKMHQNLWWAVGYNVIAFPLAAGVFYPFLLSPEIAALAMSGSSALVADQCADAQAHQAGRDSAVQQHPNVGVACSGSDGVTEESQLQSLSWHALFALLLAVFAISVGYGIVLPILPFLIERISGATDAAALSWHTGLITGTYILAIFLFAPLWGKISDRWGRRPVLLMGLTGFGASVALFALVESLPLLYVGRFLDGLFAAAIAPAAYALVGDHAPSKEWRAHRFALINIAGTLGFFAGPLLGGLALSAFREFFAQGAERASSTPFLTTSGLALVAALGIWGLVPRSRRAARTSALRRSRSQAIGR